MKQLIILLCLLISYSSSAGAIEEQTITGAAKCFVGHAASDSELMDSGEATKYMVFLLETVGQKKTVDLTVEITEKLKQRAEFNLTTKKEEGLRLIKEFCSKIDRLLEGSKKA